MAREELKMQLDFYAGKYERHTKSSEPVPTHHESTSNSETLPALGIHEAASRKIDYIQGHTLTGFSKLKTL